MTKTIANSQCGFGCPLQNVTVDQAIERVAAAAAPRTADSVLDMASTRAASHATAAPFTSAAHLAQTAVREYLDSTLFELLLDALPAEHGVRLVATQSPGEWRDSQLKDIRSQLASAYREASTQEVLDLAGGVRRGTATPPPRPHSFRDDGAAATR